jgi:Leucine-rich repeat (LRR) protein
MPATAPLRKLRVLGCSSIEWLPDTLCSLSQLELLGLLSLGIAGLPANFSALTTLRELQVRDCELLTDMGVGLDRLTLLTNLVIDNPCAFANEVSASFAAGLPDLCTLTLNGCNLRGAEFSSTQTRLTDLRIKTVVPFHESQLPSSIGMLRSLRELHITQCLEVTSLPETVRHLTALTHLNVDFCDLMTIPDAISELTNLQTCTLHCGQRDALDAIGHQKKLTHLRLGGPEGRLPVSLTNLTRLSYLEICFSRLGGAFPAIDTLPNLQDLRFVCVYNLQPGVKLGPVLARCTSITHFIANAGADFLNNHILPSLPSIVGLQHLVAIPLPDFPELGVPFGNPVLTLPEAMTNLTQLTCLQAGGRNFHSSIFQLRRPSRTCISLQCSVIRARCRRTFRG